jgi:tetratricopeptide (TPR) repeat protein
MKTLHAAVLAMSVAWCVAALGQQPGLPAANETALSAPAAAAEQTPAQQRIGAAKQQIAADSKKVQAYNDLATAYIRRARETDDARYYHDAEDALNRGYILDANDFQLQKTQVALMLARGEFAQAQEKAVALNKRTPDDVMVYGYLAEAEFGLGEYNDAVSNAQWMMNMLPNNVPALMIAARLRAHFGDPEGAIQFLKLAYTETSPTEVEELAWIANQIAAIEMDQGKAQTAMEILERADQIFPNYPSTKKNLARARAATASHEGAAINQKDTDDDATTSTQTARPEAQAAGQGETDSAVEPARHDTDESRERGLRRDVPGTVFEPVPAELLTPRASETDRVIGKAQAVAAANPKDAKAYASLGAAYFQRARETGDVSDYELAEQALNKSLEIDANDFSAAPALETLAEVCMGEHRFADALTHAQKALALGSGDLSPFAIVGDAYADMGEYDKARDAYRRLTPGDVPASPRMTYARDSRLAYLSLVKGDTGEAIRLMELAVEEGTEAEIASENLAWLSYELGEFETQSGDAAAADAAYRAALRIHPGDYRALAGLAKLRANYGRYAEAITLYRKAIAVVPMPIFVAGLGDVYERIGDRAEAKKQYDLVEYIGRLGLVNQVLHNRDLALFYADHDTKLDEGLALAHKEFEVRHDIYTWDALAWALYKNGRFDEAAKASNEALNYGTQDSLLLFHAGMIAAKLGQADRAQKELKQAIAINPHFHLLYAEAAKNEIAIADANSHARESAVANGR